MTLFDRLVTEYHGDTQGIERASRRYDRLLARNQRTTDQRLSRVEKRWERSNRVILQSTTALTGFLAYQAAGALRGYAVQWRSVERSLTSIGETSDAAKHGLVDLAIRTRTEVSSTASAVQRMAKSTGADFETTMRRVETLQKLLAVGGASGTERASVSLQLGQALKSGRLSGDEFRSISENAPIELIDALARAAGIARSELKGFAQEQKLTNAIVLTALDELATTADVKFRALAVSGDEAVDVLTSGLVSYIGQVDEALGTTEAINGAMVSLGTYMAGSTEHAETMADALRVLGAVAISTAGGRGIGALNKSIANGARARGDAVKAAQRSVDASKKAVVAAQKEVQARNILRGELRRELEQRKAAGLSTIQIEKRLEKARKRHQSAVAKSTALQGRAVVAANTLTAAQARLSLMTRISTASMRGFNSVMAFFGGPVGAAITLISLGAIALSNMSTAADRAEKRLSDLSDTVGSLGEVNAKLTNDYSSLRDAQQRLAAAYGEGGQASIDAARQDIKAVEARIAKNKELRAELALVAKAELNAARAELEVLHSRIESQAAQKVAGRSSARMTEQEMQDLRSSDAVREYIQAEKDRAQALIDSGASMSELTNFQQTLLTSTIDLEVMIADLEARLGTLTGSAGGAAGAMDGAAASADNLGASAAGAIAGISGLIAAIPKLQQAAQLEGKLKKAMADRDAEIASIKNQDLAGIERQQQLQKVNELFEMAVSEIDGTAEATRNANEALKDYTSEAHLNGLSARERAVQREKSAYQELRAELIATGATEDQLAQAKAAHAANLANIHRQRSGSGGGSSRAAGLEIDALSRLSSLRDLLVESGFKQLYIEQSLNAERERLAELAPELEALGLSQADAQAVLNDELARTKERLEDVKTASEEAHETMARGFINDLRHMKNARDGLERIAQRLEDLAFDPIFDMLEKQLAQAFSSISAGSGGGWLGNIFSNLFGGGVNAYAKGDVFKSPTFFNYGSGKAGVMGEAGPEAVMPLARGSDGRLGVIAQLPQAPVVPSQVHIAPAAAASAPASLQVHIHENAADSDHQVTYDQSTGRVDVMLAKTINKIGMGGAFDRLFRSRYGVTPKVQG